MSKDIFRLQLTIIELKVSIEQEIVPEKLNRTQQFFAMPQHAWVDEDYTENSRHD
jgi:hypothetical protein